MTTTQSCRAIDTSEASDRSWRGNLYDRARRTLASEMRARRPQPTQAEIARELAALEAAIKRIEAESARSGSADSEFRGAAGRTGSIAVARIFALAPARLDRLRPRYPREPTLWPSHRPASLLSRAPASRVNANTALATKDGDIPPGIDGGPMDADQSYVFRRQPTFYRTLQPVGTVIIDKLQHFLYLVQPNSVALRYGIGIGGQCADLVGLRHIASMAEWPSWEAPPDMAKQKLAQSGTLTGAPGNPLGARVLELGDNRSRIHGTNAPKTIGTNIVFGCIRLVNDDIVDLYGRVRVGTPVLVN